MLNPEETHGQRRERLIEEEGIGSTLFDKGSSTGQTNEGDELECEFSRMVEPLIEKWINKGFVPEDIYTIILGPLWFWCQEYEKSLDREISRPGEVFEAFENMFLSTHAEKAPLEEAKSRIRTSVFRAALICNNFEESILIKSLTLSEKIANFAVDELEKNWKHKG